MDVGKVTNWFRNLRQSDRKRARQHGSASADAKSAAVTSEVKSMAGERGERSVRARYREAEDLGRVCKLGKNLYAWDDVERGIGSHSGDDAGTG